MELNLEANSLEILILEYDSSLGTLKFHAPSLKQAKIDMIDPSSFFNHKHSSLLHLLGRNLKQQNLNMIAETCPDLKLLEILTSANTFSEASEISAQGEYVALFANLHGQAFSLTFYHGYPTVSVEGMRRNWQKISPNLKVTCLDDTLWSTENGLQEMEPEYQELEYFKAVLLPNLLCTDQHQRNLKYSLNTTGKKFPNSC